MHKEVIGLNIGAIALQRIYKIATVFVALRGVELLRCIGIQFGVVVGFRVPHRSYVHAGHIGVGDFETAILVACIKYQLFVIYILKAVSCNMRGLYVCYGIIKTPVLIDHGIDLARRVGNIVFGMVNRKTHLLMRAVHIYIGVAAHRSAKRHTRLNNRETELRHRLLVGFIVNNLNLVVTR